MPHGVVIAIPHRQEGIQRLDSKRAHHALPRSFDGTHAEPPGRPDRSVAQGRGDARLADEGDEDGRDVERIEDRGTEAHGKPRCASGRDATLPA